MHEYFTIIMLEFWGISYFEVQFMGISLESTCKGYFTWRCWLLFKSTLISSWISLKELDDLFNIIVMSKFYEKGQVMCLFIRIVE